MAELSTPKLSALTSRVSIEGLKLMILSADFLLNLEGFVMAALLGPSLRSVVDLS